MIHRNLLGCLIFCLILYSSANAQSGSAIFQDHSAHSIFFTRLPDRVVCDSRTLATLFEAKGKLTFSLGHGYDIHGEILDHTDESANLTRISIRVLNDPGTWFSISQIRLEDGSLQYTGHLLHPGTDEAVELRLVDGTYYLIKTQQHLIMPD